MSLAEFESKLLALPEAERLRLVELLWNSLAPDGIQQRSHDWAAEAERRLEAADSGRLALLDAEEVFHELRETIIR